MNINLLKLEIMNKKNKFLSCASILVGMAVIITNSCKKDDNTQINKYTIGQSYGGGIVIYIDNTGQHGLIAAESDQSEGIQWYNGSFLSTSATGTLAGDGAKNTRAIVAAQGTGDYAAKICDDLVLNGYSDWFLPSQSDLTIMYSQSQAGILTGFNGYEYWSSTEKDSHDAWGRTFGLVTSDVIGSKSTSFSVRAVRAF
jgi:hypothetical protein